MFPGGLNGGLVFFHLDVLFSQDILRQYWDSVSGIVKEGGYASPRLGNMSNGLVYSDQDIANIMCRAKRTIDVHIESIKFKFSVENKSHLIEKAMIEGYMTMIPQHLLGDIS